MAARHGLPHFALRIARRRLRIIVQSVMVRTLVAGMIALLGCGSSPQLPDAAPDAAPDAPPPRGKVPDLRFQWVGAYPGYEQSLFINIAPELTLTDRGDFSWAPLELTTALDGHDASWELTKFTPVAAIEPMESVAKGGDLATMAGDIAALVSSNHVITSLDITARGYGLVATAPLSSSPTYGAISIDTDRAGLAAWAAEQGRLGHVVTAVARNDTAIRALAFARSDDTSTYEAQVADATFSTLVATATSLAADGYIITAFGRNGEGPLLLVGTRPTGATTPRTIMTQTAISPDLADHGALVAWVFDPGTGDPSTFANLAILER